MWRMTTKTSLIIARVSALWSRGIVGGGDFFILRRWRCVDSCVVCDAEMNWRRVPVSSFGRGERVE